MPYNLTTDWFSWAPPVWEQLVHKLPARKMFLEIGAYEGRSTAWTVENMLVDGGEIIVVDTWEGGEEHATMAPMPDVEGRFDYNASLMRVKFPDRHVTKNKATSYDALCGMRSAQFDFVYIDGSHKAKDVLTDAVLAWPLLKPEGIMVFDDYTYGLRRDILHRPKLAIDAFVNIFSEEIELVHAGMQFIIRKEAS